MIVFSHVFWKTIWIPPSVVHPEYFDLSMMAKLGYLVTILKCDTNTNLQAGLVCFSLSRQVFERDEDNQIGNSETRNRRASISQKIGVQDESW